MVLDKVKPVGILEGRNTGFPEEPLLTQWEGYQEE